MTQVGDAQIHAFETIKAERRGPALVVMLNRPERRNAISIRMMDELAELAERVETDAGIRTIVITGGAAFFSAGGDLHEAARIETPTDLMQVVKHWKRMNAALESSSKPVIAAIEGFCITGGCELALACDIRIAGAGASFGITSSKIGTVPGAGGTQRLPRIVGVSNALHILFTATPIDAAEAYRIGLVSELVAEGQALPQALKLSETLAQRAPLSLALIKRAVYRGVESDLETGLALEETAGALAYGSADRREGIAAFFERRDPSFQGR
ncbi:enoyl-CoA hydratase-related protein [Bosea sp. (in: a-proteobacteria)]|uniref:enoyl-CoA hydratase/isomerase family protein n=1 Tax=Bosea sp. (in: a-proteobacteria) TaxID=1871050 RepID=UPI002605CA16|nr:enoyl-CoA hydratase-related protein [Bosea sp. (in: a-proteobacteria)]MCO5089464.1 enoyl-CoA hydratase-related protein [Bosea sp. (in: a-proteobacteria)]